MVVLLLRDLPLRLCLINGFYLCHVNYQVISDTKKEKNINGKNRKEIRVNFSHGKHSFKNEIHFSLKYHRSHFTIKSLKSVVTLCSLIKNILWVLLQEKIGRS